MTPTASDVVADNIRVARERLGLSMAELGKRCGLSKDVIQNIEGGRRDNTGQRRRDVTVDEVLVIAVGLGLFPAELLPEALRNLLHERDTKIQQKMRADLSKIGHEQSKLDVLQDVEGALRERLQPLEIEMSAVREEKERVMKVIMLYRLRLQRLESGEGS